MRALLAAVVLALALPHLAPSAAQAEVRVLQAVGAVPIDPSHPPEQPLRDLALRRALRDALRRTALEMLPELDSEEGQALVGEALGEDPLDYVSRFRILEDRGPRAALYSADPDVEEEYVVVAEVHVDTERVRSRLAESGLVARPSGGLPSARTWVVIEDLAGYAPYAAVRRALRRDPRVRQALPVELARGRAVLRVDADGSPQDLVARLQRNAAEWRIEALRADGDTVVLRVRSDASRGPAEAGSGAAGD